MNQKIIIGVVLLIVIIGVIIFFMMKEDESTNTSAPGSNGNPANLQELHEWIINGGGNGLNRFCDIKRNNDEEMQIGEYCHGICSDKMGPKLTFTANGYNTSPYNHSVANYCS
jgi:uncharacterized membrane protein